MKTYHQPQLFNCDRHNQRPWVHYSFVHSDMEMKMDHIILRTLKQGTRWQLHYETFTLILMLFVQRDLLVRQNPI